MLENFNSSWLILVALSTTVILMLIFMGGVFLSIFPSIRLSRSAFPLVCENLLQGTLIFSLTGFLGVLAGSPLIQTSLVLIVLFCLIQIRQMYTEPSKDDLWPKFKQLSECSSLASLAVIVIGSIIWSANNIEELKTTSAGDLILAPWNDIFYHARLIGLFAQFTGDSATLHYSMSGEPMPIYHYASYIIPSIISSLGNIPSLQIATSFYPVFGMILTGASMALLGNLMTDSLGVLLALFILFFVPDPSFWMPPTGFNGWYSYFFFQQVGIGGTYAVAIMGLALAYALRAFQLRSSLLISTALVVFAAAGVFKVQIVLAYGIFFVVFVWWSIEWKSKLFQLGSLLTIGLFFLIAIHSFNKIPNTPSFFISSEGIKQNIWTLTNSIPTPTVNIFYRLYAAPLAVVVLFLKTYGLIFPSSLLVAWALRNHKPSKIIIKLLLTAYFGHVFIALFIANNIGYGDFYEVNHKTFVWPFFVISFCFSVLLWNFFRIKNFSVLHNRIPIIGLASFFIIFTIISSDTVQKKSGHYSINTPINKGLFASAVYIKNNSLPGEVAQLCENDNYNELGSITERPIYIVRIAVNSPPLNDRQIERFAKLKSILQAQNLVMAKSLVASANITWLLMTPNCQAEWEKQLQPVFSSEGYRLYNTKLF
jgi:hypothetical protein